MNTFAVKQSNSQKRKKNSKGKIELARVSHCRGFKIWVKLHLMHARHTV